MKSCSICASTIDQCVHTSIAHCHALTQPCYAWPCLDPNVLRLAMPRPKNVVPCHACTRMRYDLPCLDPKDLCLAILWGQNNEAWIESP